MLKKIKAIILVIMIFFVSLPLLKNVILYFNYYHEVPALKKVSGRGDSSAGKWFGIFDVYPNTFDGRYEMELDLLSDTSGLLIRRSYHHRIDGDGTRLYDWRALLPFDKDKFSVSKFNIKIKDDYLYCRSIEPAPREVMIFIFKISGDSLFLKEITPARINITNNSGWGLLHSGKVSLISKLNPLLLSSEWKQLFREIKNNYIE